MIKKYFSIAFVVLFSFLALNASAQKKYFSGIYTIGGSNANYQTIQKALTDLLNLNSEVIGRVTFNIRPGTYPENLTFKPFVGASAKNFVVFKSETGKASDVIISDDGDNTLYSNQVIRFEGCSFYTLQDLTIENNRVITATNQFASAIHLTYNRDTRKPSEYNTINRCIIKVDSSFTVFNGNTVAIVSSDINNTSLEENCANYNTITNNTIYGGTFGIKLLGKSLLLPSKGNKINGNKFFKCYSAIDVNFCNVPSIASNQIFCRQNPNEAQFGIRVRNSSGNFSIQSNIIKDYGTFGIFLLNVNGGAAALIYNNMVMGASKPNYSRGIHVEYSKSLQLYHNTVYFTSAFNQDNAPFALEFSTALPSTKISLKNNIFYATGGATSIIIRNSAALDTCNYNDYYVATGTNLALINGGVRTSMTSIRTQTTKDQQSLNTNPLFASPTSLRINSKKLIRKAYILSFIQFDFENQPRDPEMPDIGADEVIRSAVDLEVFHLDKNFVPKEGLNTLPVVIKNDGLLSLNGNKILISYKVDNAPYTTPEEFELQTLSKSYSKQIFNLATKWDIPSPGQYTLILRVSPPVPNDTWQENDADTLLICVGLNGKYTIGKPGGGAKNYPDFASAIAAFDCGVGGATTFDVYPGTYSSFVLPHVKGTSSTNTITFKSFTGNAADVIVQNATSNQNTTNHYTVQVNGTDYLTISKFTINNTASVTAYASGFHVTEGSNYVTLDSSIVTVPTSSSANDFKFPVVMSQKAKIDSGGVYSNVYIKNCTLRNGVTGIQMYGRNASTRAQNNGAINNTIDSTYLFGISTNFVNVGELSGNKIRFKEAASLNSEAIRIIISKYNTVLNGNRTYGAGNRALNLTSVEGITGVMISNNMFGGGYKTSGNGAGIYLNEVNKVNVYHNSVVYDQVSTATPNNSAAFFLAAGSNVTLYNNIFYNPAGGYAFFVTSQTSVRASNYNIYYTDNDPNTGLYAYWTADRTNMTALKAAMNGFEINSLELDPQFVSTSNLHTSNTALEGKGYYFDFIPKDFDGEFRNPLKSDIGADEFIVNSKDLALVEVTPLVFSTDPNIVNVKLMNLGSTSLDGSTIKLQYTSDGNTWVPAGGESYTIGSNGASSLANPYSTAIFNFSTLFNATANNTYPFGVRVMPSDRIAGDPVTANDSNRLLICTGLKTGTYTIGGSNPTYTDITSAISSISCGITGPVVFNVRPGTYNERFTIGNPKNTSSVNTITIKAENNDSSSVIINYAGAVTPTTRNVVRLNRSKNIILKYLTFQNASNSLGGFAGIQITSEARNIEISNCSILMDTLTTSPSIYGITTSDSTLVTLGGKGGGNITIKNNYIRGGSLGIALKGLSQYTRDEGFAIDGNTVKQSATYGISTSNADVTSISNNKIIMRTNQLTSTGLYMSINRVDTRVYGNKIYNSSTVGVSFNDVTGLNGVLLANNMIGGNFRQGIDGAGIQLVKVFPIKVYNNSVFYDGTSVFGASIKVDNDSRGVRLLNNSLYNSSVGFCLSVLNTVSIDTSDNNNYNTKGVLFCRWGGSDYSSFDEFRDASLTDEKSVSVDPDYFTKTDLHLTNTFLDGGAMVLKEVATDYDGEPRNAEFPDIGADEFLIKGDIEVISIDSPLPSPEVYPSQVPVSITVRNKGLSKISGLNVKYFVNNVEVANEVIPVEEPYKPLLPTDLVTYDFATLYEPTQTGVYNLRVEAYLPDDIDITNNSTSVNFKSSISSIVDGEVSSFVSPANSYVNQLTPVVVLIRNSGTVPMKDFNVNYRLRSGGASPIYKTEYFGSDSIMPLQSSSFRFSDSIDCSDIYDRFIDVYISDLADDINQLNDTLNMYIKPYAGCFQSVSVDTKDLMLTKPWPNPTSTTLNYDVNVSDNSMLSIELVDVLGHVIRSVSYDQLSLGINHLSIDVADLTPGIYYSRVMYKENSYTDKIVITK